MTTAPHKDICEQLEHMVDLYGLTHVLAGLELVCLEKAEHLITNWQDRETAKAWKHNAAAIYCAIVRIKPPD